MDEKCKCGKPATIKLSSGTMSVALCSECWDRVFKKAKSPAIKKSVRTRKNA